MSKDAKFSICNCIVMYLFFRKKWPQMHREEPRWSEDWLWPFASRLLYSFLSAFRRKRNHWRPYWIERGEPRITGSIGVLDKVEFPIELLILPNVVHYFREMYLPNVAKTKPLLYSKEELSTKNDLINPNYKEPLRWKMLFSSSAICLLII